ncbi:LCP family protein [Micromonospora sp. MMS20-R2-29]|uniref:LCP family protein n=2 Tax=Micromonospora humidisoli TaxID=2807622 RepID=A0ABS2JLY1_9ACTN|nr:LCP family protein [Micromonospora humidisoli]
MSSQALGPESASGGVLVRPGSRRRRIALSVILAVALLAMVGIGVGVYLKSVESDVGRVDAFTEVPTEARPPKAPEARDARNLLILGSDSRDPENTGGSRSDTIILAHIPQGGTSAQLVSIPRDTWVHVPASKNGQHGNRDAKINAAFAWGGVPLLVQTVEEFTKVRIDHVVMVDFAGFKEIVDALDGVQIDVERSFTSTHSLNPDGRREFVKGPQTMDGAAALDYARERYAFPDGDFARIRHQQQLIRAVLDKAASGGLLANPGRLDDFLRATADAVTVDKTLSLVDLATELRHLRGGNLTFATSPSSGTGMIGTESVVLADEAKARTLYTAIRRDAVPDILAASKPR